MLDQIMQQLKQQGEDMNKSFKTFMVYKKIGKTLIIGCTAGMWEEAMSGLKEFEQGLKK